MTPPRPRALAYLFSRSSVSKISTWGGCQGDIGLTQAELRIRFWSGCQNTMLTETIIQLHPLGLYALGVQPVARSQRMACKVHVAMFLNSRFEMNSLPESGEAPCPIDSLCCMYCILCMSFQLNECVKPHGLWIGMLRCLCECLCRVVCGPRAGT